MITMSKGDYSILSEKLKNSKNEEEVYHNLKEILKSCNISNYKSDILDNPYFRLLIPDIVNEVLEDLNNIKKSIRTEIFAIDDELSKIISNINDENIDKLKELKRECISLIFEVEERERDLKSLC
jgi:predicted component of type VI protein secretion system